MMAEVVQFPPAGQLAPLAAAREKSVPLPVKVTICGLLVDSSVIVRVPGRNPVVAGAKVTLMAQLAAGTKVAEHVFVWA